MLLSFFVFLGILLTHVFFAKLRVGSVGQCAHLSADMVLADRVVTRAVPILVVSLLIGLRYEVGVDYPIYKEIYEFSTFADIGKSMEESGVEPLFTLICSLLHKCDIPYYGMFFMMTVIPFCFFYSAFRQMQHLFIPAVLLLYMTGTLFWYLNIMRQGVSFFIILYAIQYIRSRSLLKYLFWIVIAAGFHVSAFIFIPLYLLAYVRRPLMGRWIALVVYLFTWIYSKPLLSSSFHLFTPLLEGRYAKYANVLETWEMGEGTGLGVLILHIIDLTLIYFSPKCVRFFREERFDIYYNLFFIGALLANIAGLNMLLSRVPFCLISMRVMVAAFSLWYAYKFWKGCGFTYKLAMLLSLLCGIAHLFADIINTEYSFVSI